MFADYVYPQVDELDRIIEVEEEEQEYERDRENRRKTETQTQTAQPAATSDTPLVYDFASLTHCFPPGSIIYVKRDYLSSFMRAMLPHFTHPFVLLTGQSDYNAVYNDAGQLPHDCNDGQCFTHLLSHPLLIHWWAQNVDIIHEKLSPLPIGINANEHAYALEKTLKRKIF